MTTWKPIRGYEGYYEVSDTGLVRGLDRVVEHRNGPTIRRGQILASSQRSYRKDGRPVVQLSRNGVKQYRPVHQLVAETFLGPRPSPAHHCCHNDGDPMNNCASNLRWDTSSANRLDCVRHGNHNYAARSACNYGHEFTPENTYIRPTGARFCRTCGRERRRALRSAS